MLAVVVQGGPLTCAGLKVEYPHPVIGQDMLKDTGLLKPFCGVMFRVYDGYDITPVWTE
jgi:uncharacterized Zn-finger protein